MKIKRIAGIALTLVLLSGGAGPWLGAGATAFAQPAPVAEEARKARAQELYRQGTIKYDLGKFRDAIDLFTTAYKAWPYETLLFNIAQAYRQLGDCHAQRFYRRYLTVAGKAARNRVVVQQRIRELEEMCQAMQELGQGPPQVIIPPTTPTDTPPPDADATDDDEDLSVAATSDPEELLRDDDDDGDDDDDDDDIADGAVDVFSPAHAFSGVSARFSAGPLFLDAGDVSARRPSITMAAAYAHPRPGLSIELGGVISFAPLSWTTGDGANGNSGMTAILANVGVVRQVMPRLAVRGELGAGILTIGNTGQDGTFNAPGSEPMSRLTMFNLRAGLSADIAITPELSATFSPLTYSFSPGRDGMHESIDRFSRLEVLAGLGYRF